MTNLIDLHGPAWHAQAACNPDHGHDPDLWFPINGDSKEARDHCATCPVQKECLTDALEHNRDQQAAGIRGGLTSLQWGAMRWTT